MKNNDILLNQNELVQYLKKPSKDFTRDYIIRFIESKGLSEKLYNKNEEIGKFVRQYLHCS
jgi:hypothetical protein